jgi:transcriptional regulator with XRE-family HTH domain
MSDVRVVLKSIIHDRGFSQAAIARKAKMSPAKLSDILNLRRRLEANDMFALCDAMNINCNDLRP